MKTYSLDLRQKLVDTYAKGNISQRQLTKDFGVTLKFAPCLVRRSALL